MTVVLPRLDRDSALPLIEAARAADRIEEITARLPDETVDSTWPAVGDARIDWTTLRGLRDALLDLARDHGLPGRGQALTGFDATAARTVRGHLELSPHEAAHNDAWTYLTCCWLLDVAVWRFGPGADLDRFLGHVNRNTFRRLWWRAEILGDGVDLSKLGEDELVNILERPTLTADPLLARTITGEFLRAVELRPDVQRMMLMREATKRVLRRTPFLDFSSLDEHQLVAQVRAAFDVSSAALAGKSPPPEPDPTLATGWRAVPSPDVAVLDRITVVDVPTDAPIRPATEMAATPVATAETGTPEPARRGNPAAGEATLSAHEVGLVAVDLAARTGRVTNETLRELLSISPADATHILRREVRRGSLVQRGRKRGTYYSLPSENQVDFAATADATSAEPRSTAGEPATGATLGRSNRTILSRLLNRSD